MTSPTIFAVPTGPQNHGLGQAQRALKRKRRAIHASTEPGPPNQSSELSEVNHSQSIEYTAVLTPTERSQRRLAGLSLDQEPPSFPFPHAGSSSKPDNVTASQASSHINHARPSLHHQHLAAMTALLHRCIMTEDYERAGRALGLLLRDETGGHAIDIRNEDLWGIGAEILFRQRKRTEVGPRNENESDIVEYNQITREGFECAKVYYERLIVQYPRHKTWPDAVNAVDFCIALFGLWVYFVNQEALQLQRRASRLQDDETFAGGNDFTLPDAKQWELEQARQIANAMDTYMLSVPYIDNPELVRLRAMLASWTADLIDDCTELANGYRSLSASFHQEIEGSHPSDTVDDMVVDQNRTLQMKQSRINESSEHRNLAKTLMDKLSTSSQEAI